MLEAFQDEIEAELQAICERWSTAVARAAASRVEMTFDLP